MRNAVVRETDLYPALAELTVCGACNKEIVLITLLHL